MKGLNISQQGVEHADFIVLSANAQGEVAADFCSQCQQFFNEQQQLGHVPLKKEQAQLFFAHGKRFLVVNHDGSYAALRALAKQAQALAREKNWLNLHFALPAEYVTTVLEALADYDYHFDAFKSEQRQGELTVSFAQAQPERLKQAQSYQLGSYLCRDLVNTPPNVCNPAYLGEEALRLAQQYPELKVEVLDKKAIEALGMGGVLGVAQGSVNEPRFIVMEYKPANAKNTQPVVLVGKGVTFDTGGISIKPAQGMDEMKGDMGGAAAVFGAMKALLHEQLALHVVGIVASVENMPDGNAIRPGDILKSMSGKTIEVLNTDAEGRLILCDALTYAERFQPQAVIDMATLTGAVVIALGSHRAGLMGNDEALQEALFQAGEAAHDPVWKMPLDQAYKDMMKSPFADIANISGNREAGSITAAAFLSFFTEHYPWAHLDIAGVSFKSGTPKGGTGRPVGLLLRYFRNLADA